MKNLAVSIVILILTVVASFFIFLAAIPYSSIYNIYMSITMKKWYAFFQLWWKIIDGTLHAIGYIIFHFCVGIDMTWCVFGEIFEDMVTAKEDTDFGQKGITVSSAIGHLEIDNKLNRFGKFFSQFLNKVFMQKRHAADSWELMKAEEKLRENYYN